MTCRPATTRPRAPRALVSPLAARPASPCAAARRVAPSRSSTAPTARRRNGSSARCTCPPDGSSAGHGARRAPLPAPPRPEADGIVGPATWAAMPPQPCARHVREPSPARGSPDARRRVRLLQRTLGVGPRRRLRPRHRARRAPLPAQPRADRRRRSSAPRPGRPSGPRPPPGPAPRAPAPRGRGAPGAIARAVAAANRIAGLPYRYGGGHGSFHDSGYDCSGSVSYVLHAAGRLGRPRDSGELMS